MVTLLAAALATQLSLTPSEAPARWSLLDQTLEGFGSDGAPAPYAAGTIVAQVLAGAGGAVLFGIGGIFAGAALAGDDAHGFAALGLGMIGAMLAMPFGYGFGVWLAGAIRGHQGSFWATMGTTLLGTVLNLAVLGLELPILMVFTLPAMLAGTIWVYHLTDAHSRGYAAVAPATVLPEARVAERRMVEEQRPAVSLLRVAF